MPPPLRFPSQCKRRTNPSQNSFLVPCKHRPNEIGFSSLSIRLAIVFRLRDNESLQRENNVHFVDEKTLSTSISHPAATTRLLGAFLWVLSLSRKPFQCGCCCCCCCCVQRQREGVLKQAFVSSLSDARVLYIQQLWAARETASPSHISTLFAQSVLSRKGTTRSLRTEQQQQEERRENMKEGGRPLLFSEERSPSRV